MFQRDHESAWQLHSYLDLGVSFCVWTLRVDGLRVPPFDRHDDGDHALQQMGLTSANWRTWLEEVVRRHGAADEAIQRAATRHERAVAGAVAYDPTTAWRDTPAVSEELARLWHQYKAGAGEVWKRRRDGAYTGTVTDRLWQALRPLQRQLPTVRLYHIDYPWAVVQTLPPVALLIGTKPESSEEALTALVLQGATILANSDAANA